MDENNTSSQHLSKAFSGRSEELDSIRIDKLGDETPESDAK
jgi:hypothetical protein